MILLCNYTRFACLQLQFNLSKGTKRAVVSEGEIQRRAEAEALVGPG